MAAKIRMSQGAYLEKVFDKHLKPAYAFSNWVRNQPDVRQSNDTHHIQTTLTCKGH